MSTLLEIVTEFCELKALPTPTVVLGSADKQIIQIRALLQAGLRAMSGRGAWEMLINEALWVTTATESQGSIDTLAPNGYRYLLPRTLWDRTEKLPLLGPVDSQDWQALKAIVVTGPRYSFRLRGGLFITTPAPPAGHTWVFEYVSKNFLEHPGGTFGQVFTDDNDEILLPNDIVSADLLWRWKKEKGLTYAEDFNSCEALIVDALGRDGGKPILDMGARDCGGDILPGIFVPSGNWNV